MTWTNEKPTVPGWYWYRDQDKERIIRVRFSHYSLRRILRADDPWRDSIGFVIAAATGQFAGPIPQPENAK